MLNKVILMGRLTADPDVRKTANDVSVTSFKLAVDRDYSKPNEDKKADFIGIVCWRGTADFAGKYFKKGQLVAVEGSLQTRDYEKDGITHYVTEVIADQVYFAEGKRNNEENTNSALSSTENYRQNIKEFMLSSQPAQPEFSEVAFSSEDDLPF